MPDKLLHERRLPCWQIPDKTKREQWAFDSDENSPGLLAGHFQLVVSSDVVGGLQLKGSLD